MKKHWMRLTAVALALLLTAGYFLLPMESEQTNTVNNGRKKAEIAAGESMSWTWTPQLAQAQEAALELSGVKKAQGITLKAELTDGAGNQAASLTQPVAELGEETRIILKGSFTQGTVYTLRVSAEGEGSVKLRGDENEQGEFLPEITEMGMARITNPILLYFAVGLLLLALTPVFGAGERPIRRLQLRRSVDGLLPLLTFLMIMILGLVVILNKPVWELEGIWKCWDEEVHFAGAQGMSLTSANGLREALSKVTMYSPGYVPHALGYTLTSLFTSDESILYHVSVAFSTLCFALMAALAVAHAPKYKATFMVASVVATNFHVFTSFHYDGAVIGSILLAMALLLESLEKEEPLTAGRGITLVALLSFGTVCKPAYSIMLLALMMLPASILGGKGRAWLFRGFVVLMLAWCVVAAVLPGPYDGLRNGDTRFKGTDSAAQLAFVQSNPFGTLGMLLGYFFGNLSFMLVEGLDSWASFGNNLTVARIFFALLVLLAPLCSSGEKGKSLLTPGRRVAFGALVFGVELILLITQYIVSSEVGASPTGMQPRYIVPVSICLALALMLPQKLRGINKRASDVLTLGLYAACFGINLWNILHWIQMGAA